MRRLLLVVIAVLLLGGTWWDGLPVDREQLARMPVEEAADALQELVADVPVRDLVDRCQQTIDAAVAAAEDGGLGRDQWLVCLVALRKVGASDDPRWADTLSHHVGTEGGPRRRKARTSRQGLRRGLGTRRPAGSAARWPGLTDRGAGARTRYAFRSTVTPRPNWT